jgi:hypothetical protein
MDETVVYLYGVGDATRRSPRSVGVGSSESAVLPCG